jgi:hypothetical protein
MHASLDLEPAWSVAKSVLGGTPLAPALTAPVHLSTYAAGET